MKPLASGWVGIPMPKQKDGPLFLRRDTLLRVQVFTASGLPRREAWMVSPNIRWDMRHWTEQLTLAHDVITSGRLSLDEIMWTQLPADIARELPVTLDVVRVMPSEQDGQSVVFVQGRGYAKSFAL